MACRSSTMRVCRMPPPPHLTHCPRTVHRAHVNMSMALYAICGLVCTHAPWKSCATAVSAMGMGLNAGCVRGAACWIVRSRGGSRGGRAVPRDGS